MILDSLDAWTTYAATPAWRQAFEFAAAFDPTLPDGEYPVQGQDIRAIVFSYQTKARHEVLLEAHRVFADIQILLSGAEIHGRCPVGTLTPDTDYDPARDVVFFRHPARRASEYLVQPGEFAVYYPQDAHMTQEWTDGAAAPVRKMVVKVRADLLRPGQG